MKLVRFTNVHVPVEGSKFVVERECWIDKESVTKIIEVHPDQVAGNCKSVITVAGEHVFVPYTLKQVREILEFGVVQTH